MKTSHPRRRKHNNSSAKRPKLSLKTAKELDLERSWMAGAKEGARLERARLKDLLETILTKRNAKDIKGLVEKELARR